MKLPTKHRDDLPACPRSRLSLALSYAARGWYVLPCAWVSAGACSCGVSECPHLGKHPLTKHGFHDASNDSAIIRGWWTTNRLGNIGIATGRSNLAVLDIDPRHGGDKSLAEWKPLLDEIDTYVVRTGKGGRHYYFDRGQMSVETRQDVRPGIDVIGDTGHVIAAGSSGLMQPYVCERDAPPAAVPPWLVDALQKQAALQRERHPSDEWVEEALAGVTEGRRNDTATRLAGYLVGKRVPAIVVERLLLDFAGRCKPPLPECEVRTVVASIAARENATSTSATVEVGETLPSFVERINSQSTRPMLIENLISAEGITLLHGQPRAGKSLAALEILLAISTGTSAFGLETLTAPACLPVLYVSEEDPEVEVRKRLEGMCRGRGLSPLPETFVVSVRRGLSIDEPRWQASIIDAVRRHGIRVVAFDTLRSVTSRADQGPAELGPVAVYFRKLMNETSCAILLTHHDTKLPMRGFDMREGPHKISGGGLFGVADTPIHVRRASDTPLRSVLTPSHCKFFSDPPPVTYTLNDCEQGWVLQGEHKSAEAPDEAERREEALVLRCVTENPGASSTAIQKAIGRRKNATFERLDRLAESGKIQNCSKGRKKSWHVVSSMDGSGGSR